MFVNPGHTVVNSVYKVKYYLAYVLWVGLQNVRKPRLHCKQKKRKEEVYLESVVCSSFHRRCSKTARARGNNLISDDQILTDESATLKGYYVINSWYQDLIAEVASQWAMSRSRGPIRRLPVT